MVVLAAELHDALAEAGRGSEHVWGTACAYVADVGRVGDGAVFDGCCHRRFGGRSEDCACGFHAVL